MQSACCDNETRCFFPKILGSAAIFSILQKKHAIAVANRLCYNVLNKANIKIVKQDKLAALVKRAKSLNSEGEVSAMSEEAYDLFMEYFGDSIEAEVQERIREDLNELAKQQIAMGVSPEIVSATFDIPLNQARAMRRDFYGADA